MHIIDSHFHWWPRSVSERFCKRKTLPRAHVNEKGGYTYLREENVDYILNSWTEWFDLDKQLEHMDGLGHQVDVVCSIGPFSVFFSDLPAEEGRDWALMWNEEMAGAQRKYPGRLWASAAVPLVDTRIAIEVVDDAVNRLGLMERHPNLKVVLSHTGGALPYQSGRMDKNGKAAKLPRPPSEYIKRMYTDTVSPHSAGMKFAIEYYGIDNVMYGTDYPCWDPAPCLKLLEQVKLSDADKQKLFYSNARRILNLRDPAPAKKAAREPALA